MGEHGPSKEMRPVFAFGGALHQALSMACDCARLLAFMAIFWRAHPRTVPVDKCVEKGSRRPVSRVLSLPCGSVQPFLWDARRRAPPATNPDDGAEMPLAAARERPAGPPYSVLLPVGFTLPPPLPGARCALAAPFHPCHRPGLRAGSGGLFSVALSLGSPPPAINRHRISVEPGLSSVAFARDSGCPAVWRAQTGRGGAGGQQGSEG